MRSKSNPMLISFEEYPPDKRWEKCLGLLIYEYTLTIKDICQILKCSRAYFDRYIKPFLHYIYISNGAGNSPNFLFWANYKLEELRIERYLTATTYFSRDEFENYMKSHIIDVTRQTIRVPIEKIVRQGQIDEFVEAFRDYTSDAINMSLQDALSKGMKPSKIRNSRKELESKRHEIIARYLSSNGLDIYTNLPSKYKRNKTERVNCITKLNIETLNLGNLLSVHALKDYGDAEEEIYRKIFTSGYYRILFSFSDEKGNISEKVYYLPPDNDKVLPTQLEHILIAYKYIEKYPTLF